MAEFKCEAQAWSSLEVVWIREGLDTMIRAQGSANQGKENSLFRDKFYLCCEALSFALIGKNCKHPMMLIA